MFDNSVTQEEIKALNTAKPYEFDYHVSNSSSSKATAAKEKKHYVDQMAVDGCAVGGRSVLERLYDAGYRKC